MRALLLAVVVIASACASPDPFRGNVEEVFRCQRRALENSKLTEQQVRDIEAGCFGIYEMRRRPTPAELRAWDEFGREASK